MTLECGLDRDGPLDFRVQVAPWLDHSAVGRLDVHVLKLNTPDYLPELHYNQVRDAWHGVRTPSGQ